MKHTGNWKLKLNLSIDIVMFLLLTVMAGIGFLMKYVVVSGEVRNIKYGNHVDLEFLGLTRHQWGSIHLIISLVFISLLVLHIILHWKCVLVIFKCMIPSATLRIFAATIIFLFGAGAIFASFFLKPELVPFEPLYRNRNFSNPPSEMITPAEGISDTASYQKPALFTGRERPAVISEKENADASEENHNMEYNEYEVFGSQTLQYVAGRYEVPASVICRDLHIPEDQAGQKLGWLRKQYSFTMTDVRRSIASYKKLNQ